VGSTTPILLDGPGSVLAGIPEEELTALLDAGERRRLEVGAVAVAEGDQLEEVYLVLGGSAEAIVEDRHGRERLVGRIGPGTSFGEMSLLTRDRAVATVRVVEELELLVISRPQFEDLAARFAVVYRNVAELLVERLAEANLRAASTVQGRLTLLQDEGAPPLLAYALACSLSWHTRGRTLLIVLAGDHAGELQALQHRELESLLDGAGEPSRAELLLARPDAEFGPARMASTLTQLTYHFDDVLVLSRGSLAAQTHRRLVLAGAAAALPGPSGDLLVRAWRPLTSRRRGPQNGAVDVPPLVAGDEAALRKGALANLTAAGRALGWLARDIAGLKVGVALGAGSLRGYAHFGALLALERAGIEPDFYAGCSIGSAVTALAGLGFSGDVAAAAFDMGAKSVFRLAIPFHSLLSPRGVHRFAQDMSGDIRIEELDVPVAIVAADLLTGREVVFRRGPLWQAVVASMAIPGVYPAVRMDPWVLVDGGVLDPVPTGVCAGMGADVVIGISLGSAQPEPVADAEALMTPGRPPNVLAVLAPSLEIMQTRVEGVDSPVPTLMLSPEIQAMGIGALRDFSQGRRFFADGQRAGEEAVPRLAAVLPWLRP
jgi:NTE family protein